MYWFVLSIIAFAVISLVLNITFLFRYIWKDKFGKTRQIAQNISLLLISFLITLLLLELFLKLFFAQSNTFGFTLAATNWRQRYVHVNSLGYRDKEWTPTLLEGRTKIMVLGDSFVEGTGIENPADRFSDLLGQKLGQEYAVLNAGLSGADTKDEIRNALAYPYQPDIVILSFCLNDIDSTAKDMKFTRPNLIVPPPFLVAESYALNFFYWRLYRLIPQADEIYWDWIMTVYHNPDIWQVYRGELLQMAQIARAGNSQFIVVIFPDMIKIEESRPITSQVANLYREQGVPVLDVTDLLAGIAPANLIVSNVDAHPNEFVHRLVAEELYRLVLDSQQAVNK
ncbi:MAG: SGNH/GDSL hydrolase family protein [Anaerolineae bacterium]|nr:SGNH/GDSL hydrolase family protein [Anaerolineae bacterium]